MSARPSSSSSLICSGLMKLGVPLGRFRPLNIFAKKPDFIFKLIAKSMIFVSPSELTRMLSGFTSRWT